MTGSQSLQATRSLALKLLVLALAGLAVFAGQALLQGGFVDAGTSGVKFTVNTVGDKNDDNLGDDICADEDGFCSLRAAIQEANEDPDHNTINFDNGLFAVLSPGTIKLANALPVVVEDLTINAVDRGVILDGNIVGDYALIVGPGLGPGGSIDEFFIFGGSSTFEIVNFDGGILVNGDEEDLTEITIDGVDINNVSGTGIEIIDFVNIGDSTATISNNEIIAGGDGVNITSVSDAVLDSNTVNVTGNDIQAGGEAVDIEFNSEMGAGETLDINVDNNVLLYSEFDDAVDVEYCANDGCGVPNATIEISVSGNTSIQSDGDEGVDVTVNADSTGIGDCNGIAGVPATPTPTPGCSDSVEVVVNIDDNDEISSTSSDAVRVDIDVCCETSDNTVTVTIDDGGNITGDDNGVDVDVDSCCGDSNDATVSVSGNNDISTSGAGNGVDVGANTRDEQGNPSDSSDISVDVNNNNNITGSVGVNIVTDAGSDSDEADDNTIDVKVDGNRDITGVGTDAVLVSNEVGSTAGATDADRNSASTSVSNNRNVSGAYGGVYIAQAAYGDTPESSTNSTSATVTGNQDIEGSAEEGVRIGASVCCDPANTNDVTVSNNDDISSDSSHAIEIAGAGGPAFPFSYLCCSQNTVSIENNTGTITGDLDGMHVSACGDVDSDEVDLACVNDSTTVLAIDGNDISESNGNGIRICCGDFGDPAGTKKDDRSVIRNNTISNNEKAGILIENASGIQTGPDNEISLNGEFDDEGGIVIGERNFGTCVLKPAGVAGEDCSVGSPEADGNTITQNSIFDNGGGATGSSPFGLGIDLDGNGEVGCSGTLEVDPNNCLKVPTLQFVDGNKLHGSGCGDCQIEVFLADNTPDNNDDHGEGRTYLVSTKANELGAWSVVMCETEGGLLTATQTNAGGDTSEFSLNLAFAGTEKECPTDTPTNTPTNTPPPTNTFTPTNTPPPTTPTPTITPTVTITPTGTLPTSTATPVPPTDTPVPPTATATNTPVIPATPGNVIGDVNKNDVINAIDAQLILQQEAGFITLANPKNADVNEDGRVNSVDATLILQFVAGLIQSLPV